MADSYIQVAADSTGKKMQTVKNTVGTDEVHAEIVVLGQTDGTLDPDNATSTAYEASRVIKASSGRCFCINGYSSKTSTQFILVFDSASLPAEGTAPTLPPIRVPASQNFSITFGPFARKFASGIVICNSSTANTKTIGSADCWFDAQIK